MSPSPIVLISYRVCATPVNVENQRRIQRLSTRWRHASGVLGRKREFSETKKSERKATHCRIYGAQEMEFSARSDLTDKSAIHPIQGYVK